MFVFLIIMNSDFPINRGITVQSFLRLLIKINILIGTFRLILFISEFHCFLLPLNSLSLTPWRFLNPTLSVKRKETKPC